MRCTSVVIADRHPVVLQGLTSALGTQNGFKVVACRSDGPSCIEAIRRFVPDIAILDISMPGLTGLEILTMVLAAGRGRPEAVAAAPLRSGCTSEAGAKEHRDPGEGAGGADRPRAPDHGSGV